MVSHLFSLIFYETLLTVRWHNSWVSHSEAFALLFLMYIGSTPYYSSVLVDLQLYFAHLSNICPKGLSFEIDGVIPIYRWNNSHFKKYDHTTTQKIHSNSNIKNSTQKIAALIHQQIGSQLPNLPCKPKD